MRIAVTGHSGQLVQSLLERASSVFPGVEIILLARPDVDLAALGSIAPALERAAPDIVVNAAAYTAVDKAETDADAALLINGAAAGAIASAAARLDIPVIQISTDYVFDGSKSAPYLEGDPVCPINVYGASKALGEQLVAKASPRHLILRTSWVVSPYGQNFVRTMLRLAADRERLGVVDDQYGVPTYAPHLADAILRVAHAMATAAPTDTRWGIYNVANQGETTWCGVARKIFEVSAARGQRVPFVDPIPSSAYPTPARRPPNSRLDGTKLASAFAITLPPWQDGIAECVSRLIPTS